MLADAPWSRFLKHDPLPWLQSQGDTAITAWVRRDLLGEPTALGHLRELREPQRLLRRQQPNGSWRYPTPKPPPLNYDLYETLTTFGEMVFKYGFDRSHPSVQRAAEYVFSCQSAEGDYRGIYGNQPSHTHSPLLMEVLIEAGYGDHPSIERGFRWLLGTRQDDGGWAIPARTRDARLVRDWRAVAAGPVLEAEPTRPFSHMVTGMVLRPFAVHPSYRQRPEACHAAGLLKSRHFKPDKYPDRRGREYWTKFTYPFQFTNLLTSLDTLGKLGFPPDDPDIQAAIAWFRNQQAPDGSFDLTLCRGLSDKRLPLWIGIALCRALRRLEENR